MRIDKKLENLVTEVSALEQTKEGLLKGGFQPFDKETPVDAFVENLNCPLEGTCSADPGDGTYKNVNCPIGEHATCGTTKSTEPGENGQDGFNLVKSSLI